MKNLLWYLCVGSRGGETRILIIDSLLSRPMNAHQLSEKLKYDYKTIRHHLKVLSRNSVIYAINKDSYGATYFLTGQFEANKHHFQEIWERFGNKPGKSI